MCENKTNYVFRHLFTVVFFLKGFVLKPTTHTVFIVKIRETFDGLTQYLSLKGAPLFKKKSFRLLNPLYHCSFSQTAHLERPIFSCALYAVLAEDSITRSCSCIWCLYVFSYVNPNGSKRFLLKRKIYEIQALIHTAFTGSYKDACFCKWREQFSMGVQKQLPQCHTSTSIKPDWFFS